MSDYNYSQDSTDVAVTAAEAQTSRRRDADAAELSPDERTPKRLKSAEPDLTVVVGGVEFYHYKTILCNACPFFDDMLSANMRESHENKIELPDKNPEEWLIVYKYLDPKRAEDRVLSPKRAAKLLMWFDFLGLEEQVQECDALLSEHYRHCFADSPHNPSTPFYDFWLRNRYLPLPRVHAVFERYFKFFLLRHTYDIPRASLEKSKRYLGKVKKLLLDDVCGASLFTYFIKKTRLPTRHLDEEGHAVIVNSPLFGTMVEIAGKVMSKAPRYSSIENSDDRDRE